MISIGSVSPNSNSIPPIKGRIPTGSTWDQYIPVVDSDGYRLDLDLYEFELAFIDRDGNVDLRLATATGELLRSTDDIGETLQVFVAPDDLADICGYYKCTLAAKLISSGQVYVLASGNVFFEETPAAFTTA